MAQSMDHIYYILFTTCGEFSTKEMNLQYQ